MNVIKTPAPRLHSALIAAEGATLTSRAAYPVAVGFAAFVILIAVYLGLLTALSGWAFTLEQLASFWYFVLALAVGFGVQVGLYTRLRQVIGGSRPGRAVVATSGTTSTAAMVSCCAHYLVNVLPVLGASGLVTLAAQYQVEFFWVGLAANAAGVAFIATKLFGATREHAHCATAPAANQANAVAKDAIGDLTKEAKKEKDPVCGMQVDANRAVAKRALRNRTYYFCSQGCAAKFDLNPHQYA